MMTDTTTPPADAPATVTPAAPPAPATSPPNPTLSVAPSTTHLPSSVAIQAPTILTCIRDKQACGNLPTPKVVCHGMGWKRNDMKAESETNTPCGRQRGKELENNDTIRINNIPMLQRG